MSRQTIEAFYAAFQRLDAAAMKACYAEDARFDDEAFSLAGSDEIGAMWAMLCDGARSKSQGIWRLEVSAVTDRSAHWEARYLFSATGRTVLNRIDAEFTFAGDGRIATHRDRFDFWAWSRQALGTPGVLLGWSGFLRGKVRAQAAKNLAVYRAKQAVR